MGNGRRRPQRAPHDAAIAILGKKWTSSIVGLLRDGPRRFTDVYQLIPFVSHKVLIQQLRALEQDGIIVRLVVAGGPRQVSYDLTDAGRALLPIINSLDEWARSHAASEATPDPISRANGAARRRSGETQIRSLPPSKEPLSAELDGSHVRHEA